MVVRVCGGFLKEGGGGREEEERESNTEKHERGN